jgi:hypothetical protein
LLLLPRGSAVAARAGGGGSWPWRCREEGRGRVAAMAECDRGERVREGGR